jgi:hypothetical protein
MLRSVLPIPEDLSSDDVHKYLLNTYVLVHTRSGCPRVGKYLGLANTDPIEVSVKVHKSEGQSILSFGIDRVSLFWPAMGYVNYERAAVYLSRTAKRQWRRSYLPSLVNVSMRHSFEYGLFEEAEGRELNQVLDETLNSGYFPLFHAAAFPTYYSAAQVLEKIRSGKVFSGAVTPSVAFTRTTANSDSQQIEALYKGRVIGHVSSSNLLLPADVGVGAITISRFLKSCDYYLTCNMVEG